MAASKKSDSLILDELERRASAGKIETERRQMDDPDMGGPFEYLRLNLRSGRETRQIYAPPQKARVLLDVNFENFVFLGDLDAFVDTATGTIEARISSPAPTYRSVRDLWRLPGAEVLDKAPEPATDDADDGEDFGAELDRRPENWRLRVESNGRAVELSPGSAGEPGSLGATRCGRHDADRRPPKQHSR